MLKGLATVLLFLLYESTVEGCGRKKPNKAPTISCPYVASETVDAGKTSKYMTWSTPTWDDDRDDDLEVVLDEGLYPGQYFPEGWHHSTYTVVDEDGLSSYCAVYFQITVPRCKPLATPAHGSRSCDIDDNIYGRRCTFRCDDGYWLDGSSSSYCQKNGYDSHTTPVCRKMKCDELSMPPFSTRHECTDTNFFQSACVLLCDFNKGYSPLHKNFATCKATKSWDYKQWGCFDSEKPKFFNCISGELKTSVSNFVWPTITATDNSGSVNMTQTLGPKPGSSLDDSQIIKYEAVDPTGNMAQPCTFAVTYTAPTCQPPKPAAKDTDPKFKCLNHKVGSSCQASCLTRVIGSSYIQCRQTGAVVPTSQWVPTHGQYPTCFKELCAPLPNPNNGALVCDKFEGGSMCQIHCNAKYDVPQSMAHLAIFLCVKQSWTPKMDMPHCTALQAPNVYNLRSRSYYFTGDCNEKSSAIRKSFIENLKKVATFLCPEAKCTVENVEVKCGEAKKSNPDPWDSWDDMRKRSVQGASMSIDNLSKGTRTVVLTPPPPTSSTTMTQPPTPAITKPQTEPPTPAITKPQTEPPTPGITEPLTPAITKSQNKPPTPAITKPQTEPPTPAITKPQTEPPTPAITIPQTEPPTPAITKPQTEPPTPAITKPQTEPPTPAITTASPKTHQTGIQFNFKVKKATKSFSDAEIESTLNQIMRNITIELGGVQIKFNETVFENVTFDCGPGKTVSNSSERMCVDCPPGTFHNHSSDKCELCPLNCFSDKPGQTACTRCDEYFGTDRMGSTSRQGCNAMCKPGTFSETGFAPCSPCQLGFYQPEHFQTACKQCPSDSASQQFGASSNTECTPYDLVAHGPVDLNFGSVINDWVEELTFAFWIDILPPLDNMVNISLTLTHPTRGHQLTWYLKNNTDIKMRDDKVKVQTSVRHSLWTHMALVWKGYPSFVDMYVGGKRFQHFGGHTPLCFLPQGTELSIHIGNNTGATIRGVYVIPRSNTSGLITSMAKACSAADTSLRSLVSKIKPSNPAHISTVLPSVCSEIDRCDPHPCPGHQCKSLPHDFTCVCKGGYSGKDCSTPPDFCAVDNKCEHGATCSNTNTSIQCTCTGDYKGQYCETPIVHGNWGPWSSWTTCSLTCGGGKRSRSRLCNSPPAEDQFGRPCKGGDTEMSTCNHAKCPECREDQLVLGKGVNTSCEKAADGSMSCSVSCGEGLVFPGPDLPYKCRDEKWTPSKKTLSCVEVEIPENVGLKYEMAFNTSSSDNSADKDAINRKLSECVSRTPCATDETCTYNISVKKCAPGADKCRDPVHGFKATIMFIVKNVKTEGELKAAWTLLKSTNKELEDKHSQCFTVDLSTGTTSPGSPNSTNTMTCREGFSPDQGFCSACEAGTHSINQQCVPCAKGWFQKETGQSKCDMCPAAYNTAYRASSYESECKAPPSDVFLLLVDPKQGQAWSANMSNFSPEPVPLPAGLYAEAVSYDHPSGQYFYGDKMKPGIRAVKANKTRTLVDLSYSASVGDIAVDVTSQLIFYTDKGTDVIGVVTILSQHHKKVISRGAYRPKHIVLDPPNGTLYWIDWGQDQLIERALYDGTERKVLFRSSSQWPLGLSLDAKKQKLYWTEGSGRSLQEMDVDGSNRRTVLTSSSHIPFSLTTFNGYIFYSSSTPSDSVIMRANPDGTGVGQTDLPHFKLVTNMQTHRADFNTSAVANGCVNKNGGCPFICFPRPEGQRVCACPEGYTRQENKIDCVKKAGGDGHWFEKFMKSKSGRSEYGRRNVA